MKLFKKVLAVALAGVLALSVLTGCGNGSSSGKADYTSQVVKALQNYYDTDEEYADEELKVIEGGTAMKTQLKQIVTKVLDSDVSFDGVTEEKEVFQAISKNKELTNEIIGMFPTAVVDDPTKPMYLIGLVKIEQPVNDNNIAEYAKTLLHQSSPVNAPKSGPTADDGDELTVAITDVTINNQKYMVGLFSYPIVKNTDSGQGGGES